VPVAVSPVSSALSDAPAEGSAASSVRGAASPVYVDRPVSPPRHSMAGVAAARLSVPRQGAVANLCLAVIGGPDGGRVAPLPDGEHVVGRSRQAGGPESSLPPGGVSIAIADPHLDAGHLLLRVSGWTVQVQPAKPGTVLVDGEPVDRAWELRAGQLIEAGSSLLEVRPYTQLAASEAEPDPVTLAWLVHDSADAVRRGPQHPQFLSIRLGWQPGRPPTPLSVPLGGTASVALRGKSRLTAPLLRWVLAQAIGLHSAADLTVAAAVAPGPDSLDWLGLAPHARPWAAPLSGRHVVSTADDAFSLASELREVIEIRRLAGSRGPEHRSLAVQPRVLAVLDDRLGIPGLDYLATAGPPLGVHVVRLVRATDRAPASCSICVDVDRGGREVVIHLAGRPGESWTATPDAVSIPYTRDLTETLSR
jgi:hypothetical protein